MRDFDNVSSEGLLSTVAESIAPRDNQGRVDNRQVGVLKRNLRWLLPLHNSNAPNVVTDAMWHLGRRRTVIVDLSLLPLEVGISLSNAILEGIFKYNVRNITM